jgi:hypothetical protein
MSAVKEQKFGNFSKNKINMQTDYRPDARQHLSLGEEKLCSGV